jgi:uncharacterized protein (TIGR03066 family)
MRKVSLCVLSLVFLIAAGCGSSKPKDVIVGKWEPMDEKEKDKITMLEFTSDGKMIIAFKETMPPGMKVDAKYKFLSDDEMESEITISGGQLPKPKIETEKVKVKVINKDEVHTTDSKGKIDKMKRVKS